MNAQNLAVEGASVSFLQSLGLKELIPSACIQKPWYFPPPLRRVR
jgi:hypothetical protein